MAEINIVVETTKEVVQGTIDIWGILPKELAVYILVIFTISILMQWVKKSFLMQKQKKDRIRLLWNISFPLSLLLSITGYYTTDNFIALGYWVIISLTSSTAAMGLFTITTKYIWPFLKIIIKSISDRAYIIVTGKPRNDV